MARGAWTDCHQASYLSWRFLTTSGFAAARSFSCMRSLAMSKSCSLWTRRHFWVRTAEANLASSLVRPLEPQRPLLKKRVRSSHALDPASGSSRRGSRERPLGGSLLSGILAPVRAQNVR